MNPGIRSKKERKIEGDGRRDSEEIVGGGGNETERRGRMLMTTQNFGTGFDNIRMREAEGNIFFQTFILFAIFLNKYITDFIKKKTTH